MIIPYEYPMDELVRKEKMIAYHAGKKSAVKQILKKYVDLMDEELKDLIINDIGGLRKELEEVKSYERYTPEDEVEE
jgi:hypothetical protein